MIFSTIPTPLQVYVQVPADCLKWKKCACSSPYFPHLQKRNCILREDVKNYCLDNRKGRGGVEAIHNNCVNKVIPSLSSKCQESKKPFMAVCSINYLMLAKIIYSEPRNQKKNRKETLQNRYILQNAKTNPRPVGEEKGQHQKGGSARRCMRDWGHRKYPNSLMCADI